MSRDIKYIGMDVHKEATVIAVLNGSGRLVMESIVETKASSILQFIHGLRGEELCSNLARGIICSCNSSRSLSVLGAFDGGLAASPASMRAK
jgi:hypothetical protein